MPPPLGIIKVILATSIGVSASYRKGILSITPYQELEVVDHLGKNPRSAKEKIAFDEDDLKGTTQPRNDTLVVNLKIEGFLMKNVMIEQGSGAEIMYPDLYKGLGFKAEDLTNYDTLLVGFDRNMVVLEGQIKLSIVTEGNEVMVNFIIVNAFSPYTAIWHGCGSMPWKLYHPHYT